MFYSSVSQVPGLGYSVLPGFEIVLKLQISIIADMIYT